MLRKDPQEVLMFINTIVTSVTIIFIFEVIKDTYTYLCSVSHVPNMHSISSKSKISMT